MAVPLYLAWIADAWVGALFGPMIPDTHAFGLDFLLPIYFLGLVMGFRRRPLWLPIVAASSVASILAFLYVGSPWHVSIGAVAGVIVGAVMTPVARPVQAIAPWRRRDERQHGSSLPARF